jgi:hypothetical protein
MIHPINEHLIPALRFDDFPVMRMPDWAVDIASIEYRHVLSGDKSITEAREALQRYPHYDSRALLASFDRRLIDSLHDCAERPSSFRV